MSGVLLFVVVPLVAPCKVNQNWLAWIYCQTWSAERSWNAVCVFTVTHSSRPLCCVGVSAAPFIL